MNQYVTMGKNLFQKEFVYIEDDLHVVEQFAKDTKAIGRLHIGNRGIKLFSDARYEDLEGLKLP